MCRARLESISMISEKKGEIKVKSKSYISYKKRGVIYGVNHNVNGNKCTQKYKIGYRNINM